MATTWYHAVNKQLLAQTTSGSRTSYLTDGLGSVTATQNAAGTTTATWRYKPYGALLAKTGSGDDPAFRWCGANGHVDQGLAYSLYAPLRHYSTSLGRWTCQAASWPHNYAFAYASNSPALRVDPPARTGTLSYQPYLLNALALYIKENIPCQGFHSILLWDISPFADWPDKGAVVQHIEAKVWAQHCTTGQTDTLQRYSFYEGWQYQAGKLLPPSRKHGDEYVWDGFIDCSHTFAKMDGQYAFLYPFDLTAWGFSFDNKLGVYTNQRSRKGDIRMDPSSYRSLRWHSNCCAQSKIATLTDYYVNYSVEPLFVSASDTVQGDPCKC